MKVAFGTDMLGTGDLGSKQNALLLSLQRWYSPGEVLQIATGNNGQLLSLSGPRYGLSGPLGVIEEGAMADLLLVDGDPTADLSLLADPERNLLLIIKDGMVYKSKLPES